jgi:hypothetical protein
MLPKFILNLRTILWSSWDYRCVPPCLAWTCFFHPSSKTDFVSWQSARGLWYVLPVTAFEDFYNKTSTKNPITFTSKMLPYISNFLCPAFKFFYFIGKNKNMEQKESFSFFKMVCWQILSISE